MHRSNILTRSETKRRGKGTHTPTLPVAHLPGEAGFRNANQRDGRFGTSQSPGRGPGPAPVHPPSALGAPAHAPLHPRHRWAQGCENQVSTCPPGVHIPILALPSAPGRKAGAEGQVHYGLEWEVRCGLNILPSRWNKPGGLLFPRMLGRGRSTGVPGDQSLGVGDKSIRS